MTFSLPFVSRRPPLDESRWVVIDVETTGLDTRSDRLIAIAALALRPDGRMLRIALADSFEAVLRPPGDAAVDKANILLHGIGVGAQRAGDEPRVALEAFERWVGRSPLVAFHAAFDRAVLDRACQAHLGRRLRNAWLDIAHVAEAAHPLVAARSLDEWLAQLGIACGQRHQAAADTLAAAELLLKLWPLVRAQTTARPTFRALRQFTAQRRWLAA